VVKWREEKIILSLRKTICEKEGAILTLAFLTSWKWHGSKKLADSGA